MKIYSSLVLPSCVVAVVALAIAPPAAVMGSGVLAVIDPILSSQLALLGITLTIATSTQTSTTTTTTLASTTSTATNTVTEVPPTSTVTTTSTSVETLPASTETSFTSTTQKVTTTLTSTITTVSTPTFTHTDSYYATKSMCPGGFIAYDTIYTFPPTPDPTPVPLVRRALHLDSLDQANVQSNAPQAVHAGVGLALAAIVSTISLIISQWLFVAGPM